MERVDARARFERLLSEGRAPTGTFVMSIDPAVTAAVVSAGLDFVVIDREHGPIDIVTAANHIRAAESNGAVPIVRLLSGEAPQIQATLDVGAHGVIIPKIATAEQARAGVAATRYQPGGRGFCPSTEGARWSRDEGWYAHRRSSNENTLFIPLIETREGVENLAEIAAVEGVDYIFFGLGDLAQDLDLPGGIYDPGSMQQVVDLWNGAVRTVHDAGKRIGGPIGYGFEGADFGTIDSDFGLLTSNLRTQLQKNQG